MKPTAQPSPWAMDRKGFKSKDMGWARLGFCFLKKAQSPKLLLKM